MAFSRSRLPSRFPVGTKFVIEGLPAAEGQTQVFRRFLEFPDGRHVRLPSRPGKRKLTAAAPRPSRKPRPSANEPGAQTAG
jgi:hypothetical protein